MISKNAGRRRWNLIKSRERMGKSTLEISEAVGIAKSYYCRIETCGKNPSPALQTRLENYFLTPKEILCEIVVLSNFKQTMKNKYEIRGDTTAIFIKSSKHGNKEALISTSKLEHVKEFPNTWHLNWDRSSNVFYVQGALHNVNGKKRASAILHRWITEAQDGMEVDHINHDTLNNTDDNLRVITKAQNLQNQMGAQRNSKSGVRGVHWHKHTKKWMAKIKINRKTTFLGYYDDINEAEQVVKEARAKHMPYSQEALSS